MKTGVELIADERKRQIEELGYSIEHDSKHLTSEFALNACSYIESAMIKAYGGKTLTVEELKNGWLWDKEAFKPKTPLKDLIRAGALIAAAIDNLMRVSNYMEQVENKTN